MSELFRYYEGELKVFIAESHTIKRSLLKRVISHASKRLIADLKEMNIIIDSSWQHTLDNSAIRHTIKIHGSPKEFLRGQIPVTDEDLLKIPEILDSYDSLSKEKNKRGQDVIIYSKTLENGVTIYVEEIRLGRHELAASTMYIKKKEDSPTQIE